MRFLLPASPVGELLRGWIYCELNVREMPKRETPYKRHKIFASGVHRKDNPAEAVWPAERVQALFERSKELSPALIPYTYRHPENGLPVLGWAEKESLEIAEEGGRTYLSAVPKELAVEFMQGLKDVGYDQVSIGIGQKGEIVHIGVTDKARTAVSGLGPVFERSETVPAVYAEEVTFEAAELGGGLDSSFEVNWKWQLQSWMSDVASLFQRMRDQKIEAEGLEAADKFLPAYVLDFLKRDLSSDDSEPAVSESQTFESDDMTEEQKREFERLQAFEGVVRAGEKIMEMLENGGMRPAEIIKAYEVMRTTVAKRRKWDAPPPPEPEPERRSALRELIDALQNERQERDKNTIDVTPEAKDD
jgi:hypothetical protein